MRRKRVILPVKMIPQRRRESKENFWSNGISGASEAKADDTLRELGSQQRRNYRRNSRINDTEYVSTGAPTRRSAFDQVSEFYRGRIVAYRDCRLSFREIGGCVGRKQTTVMRICDRWMQEGTMDQRG
ncbi:transposable element Tcb1 transposase [Trichonephila clavipes]|nr:transposable element Tcb1 transposase [Trichonephila clavipes]